jgi:hypothetical protein
MGDDRAQGQLREPHAANVTDELGGDIKECIPRRRKVSVTAGFMCAPDRWPHGE